MADRKGQSSVDQSQYTTPANPSQPAPKPNIEDVGGKPTRVGQDPGTRVPPDRTDGRNP